MAFGMLAFAGMADACAGGVVRVDVSGAQETIVISSPKLSPNKVFTLPDPDRLVVDIPALNPRPSIGLPQGYEGKLIKAVRLGQFDPKTSRLVFDLASPITVQKVQRDKVDEGELSVDIALAGADESAAKPAKKTEKAEPVKKTSKPQKPLIVIDAGHGGPDPGTSGPEGNDEKDLVLEYAKTLKAKLLKTGQYRVMLTREDDTFIHLRKRVDIARKAGASMFISLHADSAPEEDARGLSVYTVSERASDKEAEALAARENKADVLSNMNLSDESRDVADILISLAQRDTMNRSATLADVLVLSLRDKVHLVSNSHRFAGFAVLKAPDVPSALIEIGFLSNGSEEQLLLSKAYREKVTSGIAAGVDRYFSVEKKVGEP